MHISDDNGKHIAYRVETVGIVINVLLSAFKLIAGIVAHSAAMVSDAVHSASDVLGAFIVIIGVGMSSKAADKDHPYGHERMECIAAIILAGILCVTGIGIGLDGINRITSASHDTLSIPGMLALIAAAVSIVTKEAMYWYTRAAAKKINSSAVMASAWHHRSDALSSVGSFAGILGARLGFPILDPIASVLICIFIVKAGIDILRDAVNKMIDRSCDDEVVEKMEAVVLAQQGVIAIDKLSTRLFGSKIYVEISIASDGSQSLESAHQVADDVHDAIEREFPLVKHCTVHMNPVAVMPTETRCGTSDTGTHSTSAAT